MNKTANHLFREVYPFTSNCSLTEVVSYKNIFLAPL